MPMPFFAGCLNSCRILQPFIYALVMELVDSVMSPRRRFDWGQRYGDVWKNNISVSN